MPPPRRPDAPDSQAVGRRAFDRWAARALACGFARGLLLAAGTACARDRAAVPTAGPTVRDAWARPAAAGADGVLYFTLANPGRDTLVLVGAQADAAARTSLHETMRMGDGAGTMTHMTPIARIAVPPGDSVAFAPLGRHAMLEQLRRPLAAGDSVPFALAVTHAGGARAGGVPATHPDTIRATAVVRPF